LINFSFKILNIYFNYCTIKNIYLSLQMELTNVSLHNPMRKLYKIKIINEKLDVKVIEIDK